MDVANTFQGSSDRYNGVTVNSKEENCQSSQFSSKLSVSLKKWQEENKRCIWFKVNIKDSDWVPVLAKEGFNFHHSRDDFVMMFKWLLTDRKANLPPACHTNLGVGGMVLNDKNQILVVAENCIEYSHWKLPGGYVERGEDIKDAAIREVKEETGIDTVFESMITLRHTHNMMFGNSDVYIVVLLKAVSEKITKCDIEIRGCKWMDAEEYLEHPHVHKFNRDIAKQAFKLMDKKIKLNFNKDTLKFPNFSREITTLDLEDLGKKKECDI